MNIITPTAFLWRKWITNGGETSCSSWAAAQTKVAGGLRQRRIPTTAWIMSSFMWLWDAMGCYGMLLVLTVQQGVAHPKSSTSDWHHIYVDSWGTGYWPAAICRLPEVHIGVTFSDPGCVSAIRCSHPSLQAAWHVAHSFPPQIEKNSCASRPKLGKYVPAKSHPNIYIYIYLV